MHKKLAQSDIRALLFQAKSRVKTTSTIVAATRTYSQNQQKQAEEEKKNTEQTAIAELQAKGGEDWNKYQNSDNEAQKQELLKNNSPSYKQASETAQDWGMGGDKSRAVNAVTMAVTGALGGQTDLQVAANALAPYAANIIGKELGHGEDKNKAAQLAAHAILGAALAYVNGGNPAAGGSAAVATEAAADYLTNQYKDDPRYKDAKGEFQANLLPEDIKTQIRDLTAAIGAVVGGTVGDSAFNAQLSGVVGQNAVENNLYAILTPDGKKYDGKKNTEYLEALRSCSHAQCVNMVLTNNAKDAMKTAPEILILNGSNYKEGEIIGAGLQYLVVKENGVLKAKLLPLNYQVINSIKDLDSSRALAKGGALTAPLANLVKGLHDSTTGQSILTNEQLSMVDRAFAAMDAAGSFGMITGAFLPKGVKTTGSSKTIQENNIYRDGDLNNVLNGNPNAAADIAISQKKSIDSSSGVNNPHYDSKHGAYTSLEKQYERAMNGTNPQTGTRGAPADASKFFNSTDMKTAIDQAEALYMQNPAKYTQPNGSISVNITFKRPIGEGYIGNTRANIRSNQPIGEYRWSNTATVNIDKNTGKAFTAFPNVKLGVTKPDPLKLR